MLFWLCIALAPFAALGAFIVAKFCIAAFQEMKRGARIGLSAYKAQHPQVLTKARLEEIQHRAEQKRLVILSPSARETRH